MNMRKDITIQSLTEIEDIQIGYLDKDIVLVDSIQKYVEVSSAHLSMNVIVYQRENTGFNKWSEIGFAGGTNSNCTT